MQGIYHVTKAIFEQNGNNLAVTLNVAVCARDNSNFVYGHCFSQYSFGYPHFKTSPAPLPNELVEKGEMNKEEGKTLVHELLTEKKKQMQDFEEKISENVQNAIGKSKLALKDDVSRLEDKITELEKTIQKLVEK
jgi:polyhydroxyalkanoate synthesis regulator phasin